MPGATDQGEPERADLSNWRTRPFSRWAFRNLREVVSVADIERGSDPMPLAANPQPFDQFRLPSANGAVLSLEDFLLKTSTDGLIVLHDGRLVFEFYDHGNAADTRHIAMSITKSVAGLVAGLVQAQGVLDVEALVSDYVPEIAATAYREATVRQLLDMRTGVVLNARELHAYALATGWQPLGPGERRVGLHTFLAELRAPHRAHGGPFAYVSANTDLLGWVIERAARRRFAELVSKLLWKPMGAEYAGYITVDGEGAPRCAGGLCMTVRDLARLGQLIVSDGKRDGVGIIPSGLIGDILENGDRDAWKQGEFAAFFGNTCYRSGWYVVRDEPKFLFAMGVHGQNLFIDRANRIVIAKVSSQAEPIDYEATPLTHRAVAEIRRCLVG